MSSRSRPTSLPSGMLIIQLFGHNRHGPKIGAGGLCPFLGKAGSPSNNVVRAEAYLHTKWHLDPSSRLATIDMGQKVGGGCCAPFCQRELGPHLTVLPGLRPTFVSSGIVIHPAIWPQQTWAKNWGLCLFWGEEAGSPSNTI